VEDACATEGEQEARHADVSHENMFSWPERFVTRVFLIYVTYDVIAEFPRRISKESNCVLTAYVAQ
jgi:hypothetical protein